MTGFLTRLINRHLNPEGNVLPQVRGRFEPGRSIALLNHGYQPSSGIENDIEFNNERPASKEKTGKINERLVQKNNPSSKEKSNVPVQFNKKVIKPMVKEAQDNNADESPKTNKISETVLNLRKKSGEIRAEFISPLKKNPGNEVESKPIFEQTHLLIKNKLSKENEKSILQDMQEPMEPGNRILKKTFKSFVKPVISDPITTFSDITIKRIENLHQNSKGVLHPPAWSGKQNAGLIWETMIKETQVQSSPTIKVNIGRIEVRAVMQQAASPLQPTESPKPKLSLSEYLNKRNRDQV
jgi:hypothetical protein